MSDTRKKEKLTVGSMDMKVEEHDTYICIRFFEHRNKPKEPGIVMRLRVFGEDFDAVYKKAHSLFNINNVNQRRFNEHPSGSAPIEELIFKSFSDVEINTCFRKNGRISIYKKYFKTKLHQDTDIPAEKHFDDHGNLKNEYYYIKGKRHRDMDKGPQQILVTYDYAGNPVQKQEYFFIDNEQKKKLTWHYINGKDPYLTFEEYFTQTPKVQAKIRNNIISTGGYPVLHNEAGPARLSYSNNGKVISREYVINGDRFGYNLDISDDMVKTYYENLQIIK